MLLEQFLKQPKTQLFANWALNIWVASPESSSYPQCVVFQHQTPHLEDWDFILFMSYKQWQTSQGLFQVFPKNLHTLSSNHLFVLFILVLKKNIHISKDFCAGAQQHNTVLSSWRTGWGAVKCSSSQLLSVIVSALHLHVSVLVLFSLQIPPAPLPRWAGHREIF